MGNMDGTNDRTDNCEALEKELLLPSQKLRISVIGAAGPMGSSICKILKRKGYTVIAFDWTKNEHRAGAEFWDEYHVVDLTAMDDCLRVTRGVDYVINFASSTRGLAFSESNASEIMRNNALIGSRILWAVGFSRVQRYLHASINFICLGRNLGIDTWHNEAQHDFENLDAKLRQEHQFECRIGRFDCIYGPLGTWRGGRGKAPGAFCLEASASPDEFEMCRDGDINTCAEEVVRLMESASPEPDEFEMCGDGGIDTYAEKVVRLMESDSREPEYIGMLDLRVLGDIGSGEIVSKNESSEMGLSFEDEDLPIPHIPGPEGIFGPNSDGTLIEEELGLPTVLKPKD